MIKVLLDFCNFLLSCAPLLTSLTFFTVTSVLLAKSIKKHPGVYYTVAAIPFMLVAIPTVLRWCGIETGLNFTRLPILGQIIRDYIHVGTFAHPLLIIIMYMGALDPKIPAVKKLMPIRKELSIISGFPIFTHSLIRVANNFPRSLKYFTDHGEYMANTNAVSETGLAISNFSFVLGIVMLALFIPLWVTSFDAVHKRMGTAKWKKLQKWSYVLYAALFIHAMGIQVGGMLNSGSGGHAPAPAAQTVAVTAHPERAENIAPESGRGERNPQAAAEPAEKGRNPEQAVSRPTGRAQAKGFTDITVSGSVKRWIHIVSLLLVYGSYLFLRVRKARNGSKKR